MAEVILRDAKTGKIIHYEKRPNLVVDVGENMLAYLIAGDTTTKGYVQYMDIGDGSTTPSESDTSLAGTTTGPRKSVTYSVSGSSVTFEATWGSSEGNYTINEAGLFTASTGGNMFNRVLIGPITKDSSMVLTIRITITFE